MDFSGEPIVALCSSELSVEELVRISQEIAGKEDFVLLLKDGKGLPGRLLPSYLNAKIRISEDCSKSESMAMETLLFVAGTLRLDKAIKEFGVSDKRKFVAFASNRKTLSEFLKKSRSRKIRDIKLSFDLETVGKVASVGIFDE